MPRPGPLGASPRDKRCRTSGSGMRWQCRQWRHRSRDVLTEDARPPRHCASAGAECRRRHRNPGPARRVDARRHPDAHGAPMLGLPDPAQGSSERRDLGELAGHHPPWRQGQPALPADRPPAPRDATGYGTSDGDRRAKGRNGKQRGDFHCAEHRLSERARQRHGHTLVSRSDRATAGKALRQRTCQQPNRRLRRLGDEQADGHRPGQPRDHRRAALSARRRDQRVARNAGATRRRRRDEHCGHARDGDSAVDSRSRSDRGHHALRPRCQNGAGRGQDAA